MLPSSALAIAAEIRPAALVALAVKNRQVARRVFNEAGEQCGGKTRREEFASRRRCLPEGEGNTIERGGGMIIPIVGGRNELAGTKGRGRARKREKNGKAEKDGGGTMGGVEFQARRARNIRRILIYPVMIPSWPSSPPLSLPLSLSLSLSFCVGPWDITSRDGI